MCKSAEFPTQYHATLPTHLWREYVHLEHAHRMRTDRFVPDAVDTEFGELPPDTLVECSGESQLGRVGLKAVDVDVKAATCAIA